MGTTTSHNSARLEFRISAELRQIIEKAAASLGQTLTDYSISRLVESARKDIRDAELSILSDRDREIFLAMLDSDAEPNDALKAAAQRYKDRRA